MSSVFASCEAEWPDDSCDCPKGNVIGGWEDANDTTIVHQKDTMGGFEISVDGWGTVFTQDIRM